MLLVGGALLLTPGFVTDAIGFTCLLPGLRRPIARWIIRQAAFRSLNIRRPSDNETIEGQFRQEE